MRHRISMFRALTGAALLSLALLLSACCATGRRATSATERTVRPVLIESKAMMMTPMSGVTDDVVEVYRMAGGAPKLVAVFLMERNNNSNGVTDEHWIVAADESYPLPLYADDWFNANQSTSGYNVDMMCDAYWSSLGYPSKSAAMVHRSSYMPTYMSTDSCD